MFFRKRGERAPVSSLDVEAGVVLRGVDVVVDSPVAEGGLSVLGSVDLELLAARTAVLGLNGSGKSTLLRLLNGLQVPSAGSVVVGGVDVAEGLSVVRRRVGLLFSNPAAQLVMPTPLEDVELSLRALVEDPVVRRSEALRWLEFLGVGGRAHHSVYDLSGGERQLVALAAVLAVGPQFLLLDEPTTLLDARNRLRLLGILGSLEQRLVVCTHDLGLAAWCDEAVVVHGGSVIAQGPAGEVVALYEGWCAGGFPGEELGV